jgi:hypothetical protein
VSGFHTKLHSADGFGKLSEECTACRQTHRWFHTLLFRTRDVSCIKAFLLARVQSISVASVSKLSIINISIIHSVNCRASFLRCACRERCSKPLWESDRWSLPLTHRYAPVDPMSH